MTESFLPDANILLYALNSGSAHHADCRKWLEDATAAGHTILINDLTECALLRISTLPRIQFCPSHVALEFWKALVGYPFTRRVVAGPGHHVYLTCFLNDLKLCGNDVNDAWLAALALEHGATLVSSDVGFRRFPRLDWLNPVPVQ